MRAKGTRILRILLPGILVFIGTPLIFIAHQLRQDNLDHRLIEAVSNLDSVNFERLLNEGASTNALGTGGPPLTISVFLRTVLARLRHKSSDKTQAEHLLLCILTGAQAEQQFDNNNRNTPIYDAMAVALIRHGADIHLRGKYGQSALHTAVFSGLHRTVSLLLSRGIAPDLRVSTGMTPLMGADAESATLLLQYGADPNARDSKGQTPLMYAVHNERFAVAKILIQHRANVNTLDNRGHSTLYRTHIVAGSADSENIIRLLKLYGARLNKKDRYAIARDQADSR